MQPLDTDQNWQAHREPPCVHGNRRWECLECHKLKNQAIHERLTAAARRIGQAGGQYFTVRQVGGTKGGQARWQIIGPDGRKLHTPAVEGTTRNRLLSMNLGLSSALNAIRAAK